ncbi:cytochrome P450 [Coniophora puteana RWD-64-598 SS2]|uniref:Cytochrome P450 n=1 Tax=Coniophora puteana (strain RWD-64-598) TaxID=741705 RepID=A0A5M3N3I3_CONPW|nr:cytochrome P450 [Coniophora puteana RWD-64-598 SS2]EIW85979.1 cytochrome P450 [Coniophora puteana RWD-64-598 SS2]
MDHLSDFLPTNIQAYLQSQSLSPTTSAGYAGLALLVLYAISKVVSRPKYALPLPPGPPAKWFFQPPFPSRNIAHYLEDLTEEYGPVYTIKQGSNLIVVIGRMQAATEIMEKYGGSNIDRPRNIVGNELLTQSGRLLMETGGDRFRRMRKAAHIALQPKAAESYEPIQLTAARTVILNLLRDPARFTEHMKTYAASVVLRITYGKRTPTSFHSPEVQRVHVVLERVQTTFVPGAYLVELLPFLKVFHRLGGMRRICDALEGVGLTWMSRVVGAFGWELAQWRKDERGLVLGLVNRVKKEMDEGTASASFTRHMLETQDVHGLPEDTMAYVSLGLFGAGSDTTALALTHAMMVAAVFPETQARVQAEIDAVVGRDRVPTFEDHDKLPQLLAFAQELLRFRPIVPIGLAHKANKDIVYNNYLIPAGATILGTGWAISRDPEAFPNPHAFDPQRWLDADGKLRSDMKYYPFGFGRRVCPGQHVANRSIFINLALIFWAFTIKPAPGKPLDIDSWTDGPASRLPPFEVKFEPRKSEEVIMRALDEFRDGEVEEEA